MFRILHIPTAKLAIDDNGRPLSFTSARSALNLLKNSHEAHQIFEYELGVVFERCSGYSRLGLISKNMHHLHIFYHHEFYLKVSNKNKSLYDDFNHIATFDSEDAASVWLGQADFTTSCSRIIGRLGGLGRYDTPFKLDKSLVKILVKT